MRSTIRLFKAVPIQKIGEKTSNEIVTKTTIKNGFIFSPNVIYNYSDVELTHLIKEVTEELSLSSNQMNASFHKSWDKVKNASIEQLIIEQIIHYITTYGYEYLGIYREDAIYIPAETLRIPSLKDDLPLTIIKGYTKEELRAKLLTLLGQGIALKEETVKDVVDVALFVDLTESEIEEIRNKETKCRLYLLLNKIPEDPTEFLRVVVYSATDKTLLIKSKESIEELKKRDNLNTLRLFNLYEKNYGLGKLSQIFLRFKPLFLALKSTVGMSHKINRLRKLATMNHVPMKVDYLNVVTAKISNGIHIEEKQLINELSRVNIFRRIRLAYALKYRTIETDSILYKIRNGKGYAKEFTFPPPYKVEAENAYKIVLSTIVESVRKNVRGKTIYIPDYITYALPATEKQFTGDFPSGTCVSIDKDMVVGIHWCNVGDDERGRIDLDLSLLNITTGKIGWDERYRTNNLLFSGDMTSAPLPDGASELFHVARQETNSYLVMLNYYNYREETKIPFKILIAKVPSIHLTLNYTVNPNHVLTITKSEIDKRQKILGLLTITPTRCRFYFSESNMGKTITSSNNTNANNSRKYLLNFNENIISLNEVLTLAGANIVNNKKDAEIDLSPENLEKDKIINLLRQ